jgi:hypothetical protein
MIYRVSQVGPLKIILLACSIWLSLGKPTVSAVIGDFQFQNFV